ncbi:MAG: response regulator transcription factor, partial [Bacteroidota bacterium]
MNEKPPIRVFLTDDHQIILDGLKSLLGGADDIIVCGEANSGQEMLDRMIVDQTEVLIIDVDMPVMGGREAVSRLKEKAPDIAIIALSMHQESGVVQAMKRA